MSDLQPQPKRNNSGDLLRYAGLGAQIFLSLGIVVLAGYKLDGWLNTRLPLLVWLLPFIVLTVMIYKLVKETSKKNERKP